MMVELQAQMKRANTLHKRRLIVRHCMVAVDVLLIAEL